ncbi:hypothetical protein [Cryobacterium sp. Y62]|uniref:hypothetical protein n=1 Tax=Cryobacterium sp. Y62 TaxID=2048284 RepID=UPI0011B01DBB|nr:hypothetical protein [Cryobacterium sp. Y62]
MPTRLGLDDQRTTPWPRRTPPFTARLNFGSRVRGGGQLRPLLLDDVIAFARVASYAGLTGAAGHSTIEHPLRIMQDGEQ